MTYHLVDAPKQVGMRDHDCAFCEYESLKRPVWVSNGGNAVPAGTRCAAIAMGIVPANAKTGEAQKALRLAEKAKYAAEEAVRDAAYVIESALWFEFLGTDGRPGKPGILETVHAMGGFPTVRAAYAVWKASR